MVSATIRYRFVCKEKIKRLINEDSEIRFKRRKIISSKIKDFLINPEILKQNIDIFQKQLV